ncbi:intermembrane phospholipid transport protein YdbH family protein [Microbulbifer agarilyticus]|uniref:intermembrane phospholipid transport protein YdbH family protein n=1 Tax=Microbulbifer agarilyticus TaxID=260552 RepID=UPI001CD698BE|nr:YdbH domain-containing protein [Microbulbifer agarilyticus]MCA0901180.1 YdbH domain-containing protein [Microbulbifer agarilyticus]
MTSRLPQRNAKVLVRYFVVFTLAILVTGIVTGVATWVTRHTWLPWLINQQLDNARVTSIERLQVSRDDGDWRANIQQLVIETEQDQQILLANLQIQPFNDLIAHVFTANSEAAPKAEVSIDQLTIEKIGDATARPAPGTAGQEPESKATTTRESDSGRSQSTKVDQDEDTEREALIISDLLQQLQALPVRSVEIRTIQVPDHLPGYSTAQFSRNSQGSITGDIRNSQCDGCLLSVDIRPISDRPKFQFELTHDQDVVASVSGHLRKLPDSAPAAWDLSSNTQLVAERLSTLTANIGQQLPSSSTENWHSGLALLTQSRGSASISLRGQINDEIQGLHGISDLHSDIQVENLTVPLPKKLMGTPVLITTNTRSPISVELDSLQPLSAQKIRGELSIQVQGPQADKDVPLLNARLRLAESVESLPLVAIDTDLDLANWQEVLEHPTIKKRLAGYEVKRLSGTHAVSTTFTLPKLNTELLGERQRISDLSVEWKSSNKTEFLLKQPESKTPAALQDWRTTKVTLPRDQAVSFSAKKIPGPMQVSTPQLMVTMEAPAQSKERPNAKIEGKLLEVKCADILSKACTFQLDAKASNLSLAQENTLIENLTLQTEVALSGNVDSASTVVDLRVLNMTVDKSTSGEISADNSELFSPEAHCEIDATKTHCESPQIAVSFAPMALAEHSLEGIVFLEDFNFTTLRAQTSINAAQNSAITSGFSNYRADQLAIKTVDALTIQLASHGKFEFNDKQLTGTSTVTSGPLQFNSNWQHNRKKQEGMLELVLPSTKFSRSNSLAMGVDGLPANLIGGKLEGTAKLHWPDNQQDIAQASLSDAVVQYNNSYALGIDSTISLEREGDSWATTGPARVTADTVDAGVALNNLHFDLTISASGDLILKNFSSELLEGALTSDMVKWNFGGEKRQSTFQFTGISLRALTTELESTNFSASGLLDATIPITTDAQGVTVKGGSLQSRPPGGRMRYYGAFSPQMLSSNPQLKLVAGALEDYTYRDIHGTIQYPLSGDLQLNLKLTGNSQAIDAKRDLIINLNLENNVPSMLRSLQASRDLTDVLEQQAQ